MAHLVERLFGHAAAITGRAHGAPVNPDEKIDTALKATSVRIHDHLLRALESRKQAQLTREALIW